MTETQTEGLVLVGPVRCSPEGEALFPFLASGTVASDGQSVKIFAPPEAHEMFSSISTHLVSFFDPGRVPETFSSKPRRLSPEDVLLFVKKTPETLAETRGLEPRPRARNVVTRLLKSFRLK